MARTIADERPLNTRTARDRLPSRHPNSPWWRTLVPGELHLGYRRGRKDTAGVWLARQYLGEGRYYTCRLGAADDLGPGMSYAEAQRAALDLRRSHAPGDLTVSDAIALYVNWAKTEGKASAPGMEARARLHILPHLGHVKVAELTTDKLDVWKQELVARPALVRTAPGEPRRHRAESDPRQRKATANKSIAVLKAALTRAFARDLVGDDKAWRRFQPFGAVERARSRALSLDEAGRLINSADRESGFRSLVRAALETGCRYSELARLTVGDFADGKIAVRQSKSGHPRYVRLTEDGKGFFKTLAIGRAPTDLLLPHIRRTSLSPWRKSEQARWMRRTCVAARIEPMGFHQLRHTWASLSIMNGVPLLVVSDNLGHTTTRMVERHYGHLTQSYMDEAIAEGAPRFGAVERTNVISRSRRQ